MKTNENPASKQDTRPTKGPGSKTEGTEPAGKELGSTLLRQFLADTFVLYMKTYAVHWNYRGSKFFSVHKLTEEHYQELAEAIDEIAERMRAKDETAPISLEGILNSADLREMKDSAAGTDQALRELVSNHQTLAQKAREAALALEDEDDDFSHDMMVARIGAHEKAAWMLKSFLEGAPLSAH